MFRFTHSILFLGLLMTACTAAMAAEPGEKDEDAPEEFTKTKSGLEYRILRKGTGERPKATDKVEVHYKGWLEDKTEFDSSYKRDKTLAFPLNGVIKGWKEGLQLVKEGGMIELKIPAELDYGKRGVPQAKIPPDATLYFLVELVEIK